MELICRKASECETAFMKRFTYWESEVTEFDYHYDHDETFVMLEGQATVTYSGGSITFGPGDLLYFPEGLDCRWKVTVPVKKYFR